MSDTRYQRLEDAPPGCLRRFFRALFNRGPPVPPTAAEITRQNERDLRALIVKIPAWMTEQERRIESNTRKCRDFKREGRTEHAMKHARSVILHRRYLGRLSRFYSTINEAILMQKNAAVVRQVATVLEASTAAMDTMMEDMSAERISEVMIRMQEQREDLDDMDEELARSIDERVEKEMELGEEHPDVAAFMAALDAAEEEGEVEVELPSVPVPVPTKVPQKKKKQLVAL